MTTHFLPRCLLGLAFSTGMFAQGVKPPPGIDVILVAPKGSGTTVRRLFLEQTITIRCRWKPTGQPQ